MIENSKKAQKLVEKHQNKKINLDDLKISDGENAAMQSLKSAKSNTTKNTKKFIKITQIASTIGCSISQRRTLIGLGLQKINSSKILEDTLSTRGMIKKISHLLDKS